MSVSKNATSLPESVRQELEDLTNKLGARQAAALAGIAEGTLHKGLAKRPLSPPIVTHITARVQAAKVAG